MDADMTASAQVFQDRSRFDHHLTLSDFWYPSSACRLVVMEMIDFQAALEEGGDLTKVPNS